MSRLQTLLLALFIAVIPVAAPSGALAAPAPGGTLSAHTAQAADDDAGATEEDDADDPAEADDPAADDDELDLALLCDTLADPADDPAEEADDPAEADDPDVDLSTLGDDLLAEEPDPADDQDDTDAPDDGDLADLCAEDPADEPADGGRLVVTLADLLKGGTLSTGAVSMSGPGTVTQEIWFPGKPGASAASVSAKKKPHAAGKKKGKAAKTGRLLAGKVTRTVRKAGVVHLSVRLTSAARTRLKGAKKDVRLSVKTVTKATHGRARTRTGTVTVKRKAGRR